MSASKWTLCACLLTFFLNCSAFRGELTAKRGDDVLLPCQVPRYIDIFLLKWIRPDLESEGLVYFFRDNHFYEDFQHSSFRGRVELKDPEMKDGEASVILKNVNFDDAGTYECYVRITRSRLELFSSIKLNVQYGPQQIKVKAGQDVTLPCQDPRGADIELLEWTRLEQQEYIFLWQYGRLHQHRSYYGRVKLRDPEMKDGDVSVILKNVNVNDAGTYDCRVRKNNMFTTQLINTITLTVDDSGEFVESSGNTWDGGKLVMVVSVVVVVVVHFVGISALIYRKCKEHRKRNSNQPPVDRAGDLQLHELQVLE